MRTCKIIFLAATVVVLLAAQSQAGRFCHHCGRHRDCKKICRLVVGKKKETKTEYVCESEDFCIPGPSRKIGVKFDGHGHHHRTVIRRPMHAKVHTRKKLVKKEVSKEVPEYKFVVEEYCCVCGHYIKIDRESSDKEGSKDSDKESDKGADKDAGEDSSKAKGERLPSEPETLPAPRTGDHAAGDYRAYYLGAEPPATIEGDSAPGIAVIDDGVEEAASREPRRLFQGLFGR